MVANGTSTDGLYRAGELTFAMSAGCDLTFHPAVAQSGSQLPTDNFLQVPPFTKQATVTYALVTYSHGQKYYDRIVDLVGCEGSSLAGGTLACLRTVSYQGLKDALGQMPGPFTYQQLQLPFFPRTDGAACYVLERACTELYALAGVFLKEASQKMVTKGQYARVPLMTTDCEDEGTLFSLLTPNMTTGKRWFQVRGARLTRRCRRQGLHRLHPQQLPHERHR